MDLGIQRCNRVQSEEQVFKEPDSAVMRQQRLATWEKTGADHRRQSLPLEVPQKQFDEWNAWISSLTAAGRKDLRYLSFTQRGWSSRSLKELPRAVRVSCRGWDVLFNRD
ncbi:hypothetical protein L3Q82_005861 [Scortum barcoo]|uniref:Uncharacterized protein n=1 Tax=Scortum barcoo TaxID=214431 RepID=A0ACB8V6T2_9TELE|nr:hypothetical protein L3Q82_005861 [Scortum barcoo]